MIKVRQAHFIGGVIMFTSRRIFLFIIPFVLFAGCESSKVGENDENDTDIYDNDFVENEKYEENQQDADEADNEYNESEQPDETADIYSETDDEDSDADAVKNLCDPNPCNFKNKSVCIEIDIWRTDKRRYYCSCDKGWFGPKCDDCQRGYFGNNCKPCDCKKNEVCNDGLEGDGKCSCATEIIDENCACYPGWSGDDCEIFGENWICAPEGENCDGGVDCCFDSVCILSKCVKARRYDSESALLADSQQGTLIAAVRSGFIYFYDIDTLKEINILGEGRTANIDFSPDGSLLAAVNDTCLYLYNLDNGEKEAVGCGLNYCQELKFSPDGTMLAATNWGGFDVYMLNNGKFEPYFSDSFENIAIGINTYSVQFSADSSLVAAGAGASMDYDNIHIYDLKEKKLIHELPLYEYYAKLSFSEDGRYIAAGGYSLDGAIDGWFEDPAYIYNCSDWSLKEHINYTLDSLSSLSFNYSGDYLLIDNVVYRVGGHFFPFVSNHSSIIFSKNGQNLISIGEGALHKYSIPGFEFLESGTKGGGRAHFFSHDGKSVVSFTSSYETLFSDPLTGNELKRFKMEDLNQFYLNFKLSDSGAYSLSYADDYYRRKGFFITDLETGKIIYNEDEIMARAAAFSTDDKIFAVHDGITFTTYLRLINSGDLIFSIQHNEEDLVSDLVFSPDGLLLAVGFEERTTLYDMKTGLEIYSVPFSGHTSFFPDGSRFMIIDLMPNVFSTVDGSAVSTSFSGIISEQAVISNDQKYIIFDRGVFDISTSTLHSFDKIDFDIDKIALSPDSTLLFLSGTYFARVVDTSNSLEKFEVECQNDLDCDTGFFCNTASGRCFANIEYEP